MRSLCEAVRKLAGTVPAQAAARQVAELPERIRPEVQHVLERQGLLFARFQPLLAARLDGQPIRCHGNHHLEQGGRWRQLPPPNRR
jgi:hypothetical protein